MNKGKWNKNNFLFKALMLFFIIALFFAIIFYFNYHQEERLKVSGVNSIFNFDTNKSFDEYIQYSKNIIETGRVDLNPDNKERVIAWNSPFSLFPNTTECPRRGKRGILLMHGAKRCAIYHTNNL